MRRHTLGAAVAATALLAAGLVPGAEATGRPDPASRARVWVTTPDRSELLHERAPLRFGPGTSDRTTITVDPATTYQTVDGFGASITDSSAAVLYKLPAAERERVMRSLFDPRQGIGISFLRQVVGSSDFTAQPEHYTYDDVRPGQTDFGLRRFSIAHEQRQILPLLRRAKQLNPQLRVMATPWSPPAWMKTGDALAGGRLKDDPAVYTAYARYLTKFVQAYTAAGVPVDFLSIQNEPQNRKPSGYPGTDLPVHQAAAVIERLGPMLRAASPRTQILGYDHNWTTHPGDVGTTPPGADPETDYPYQLLNSRAARWIAGTAYHCYAGTPEAQTALHEAFPRKGIWFTECSGSHGPDDAPADIFRGTLTWHARNLAIGTTRNWARSVVNWNVALNADGGPFNGGCETCTGLVTRNPDNTVGTNAEYYTLGHLAKFVRPGATRIGSTSYGTTGWNGQLMSTAFRNRDGSTVLYVHNQNDEPRDFAIAVGDRVAQTSLPGGAVATYVWDRAPRTQDEPIPLDDARATASVGNDQAGLAIDADGSTRWQSGTALTAGQYVQVDLGTARTVRKLALDSGGDLGDRPERWQVSGSLDGTTWRPLATGRSTGQLTTAELGRARVRHLRVTALSGGDHWWTLADLRLYR